MLKLLDTSIWEGGSVSVFLRLSLDQETQILKNGLYYKVTDVIFDDDEGNIIVEASLNTYKNNPSKVFQTGSNGDHDLKSDECSIEEKG